MTEKAWLAIRRTLPEWNFRELLDELLEYVEKYPIDEVIIKVDVEEFSHGHPATEWLESYIPKLELIRDELQKRHVAYSLNPWITVGHADRGRDDRNRISGFQGMTGADGTQCRHCACHLSEGWRKHIAELWKLYASTSPRTIWIEDDLRSFNHEPVTFGCFCPLHMERFSALAGRKVSKEELAERLLAPGKPHPWRKLYYDMLAEITTETAEFLAKTVHSVNPEICMGMMSSGPRNHCAEGRKWLPLAHAAADGNTLFSRPTLGVYCEGNLKDLYFSSDSILLTRAVLPPETIELTEVENYPYTAYANSEFFTTLKMAVTMAFGSEGAAANLFDHLGSKISSHPGTLEAITAHRNYWDALADANSQLPKIYSGIELLFFPEEGICKEFSPGAPEAARFVSGFETVYKFTGCGIPVTYSPMPVKALIGERVRCLDDDALKQLLSSAVWLDSKAAELILQRGFGSLIGLKSISPEKPLTEFGNIISAELPDKKYFGNIPQTPITCTLGAKGVQAGIRQAECVDGAKVVSWFIGPDRNRLFPALIWYKNPSGGKIALHLIDYTIANSPCFFSPARAAEMQEIFRYLSDGKPEIIAGPPTEAWPLAWRRRGEKFDLAGCFNLSLDDRKCTRIELAWGYAVLPEVYELLSSGEWLKRENISLSLKNGLLILEDTTPLKTGLPRIFKLLH